MSDSFFKELFEKYENNTDTFVFDATNIDGIYKYLKTIDWSERWLIGLVVFHLSLTVLILFTRGYSRLQTVLFLFILGLCYCSERINEQAAKHWRMFAREQYFDSNGLFISIVFSVPLILNSCLIVVIWLYESYLLLIDVVKLRKRVKQQQQQAQTTSTNVSATETKKEL